MNNSKKEIFKKASVTYYTSSLFFPPEIKEDVFTLYAFVRTADDFVDQVPQDKKRFTHFKQETLKALAGRKSNNPTISDFILLAQKRKFEKKWIEAFLSSMEADLRKTQYKTYHELKIYMYGSAEVIGLFMAQILSLPKQSFRYAQKMGESMQFINFLRDIPEDISLGRTYLPQDEWKTFHIHSFSQYTKEVERFIHFELKRFKKLQQEAEKGLSFIPWRYRIPIKTASDMYKWTAEQIESNPALIWKKKIKPTKFFVITTYFRNVLSL